MKSAFSKDIARTIRDGRKRFLSIAAIVMLGVTVLVGLQMFCEDLRYSADEFFGEQDLYDVKVQSTLGLTDEDVEALQAIEGVETAEGTWSETAYTDIEGDMSDVTVATLMESGINQPYVLTGRLPETAGEVAVTKEYLEDTGKEIGDTLTFSADAESDGDIAAEDSEDDGDDTDGDSDGLDSSSTDGETEVFSEREYTIVGTVTNPTDVATKTGSSTFRSTGTKYSFFVTEDAVDSDAYTVIYIRVEGSGTLYSFSDEYEEKVGEVTTRIESIKDEREESRYETVVADANDEINDAEEEANGELADAEAELDDAQAEIDSGLAELDAAMAEIEEQQTELDDAAEQLPGDQDDLDEAMAQVEAAQAELDEASAEWEEQRSELESRLAGAEEGLAEMEAQLEELEQTLAALESVESPTEEEAAQIAELESSIEAIEVQIAETKTGIEQLEAGISEGDESIAEAQAEIDETLSGLGEWQSGLDQIASGQEAIDEALAEIEDGYAELEEGQEELDEGRAEFEDGKSDALEEIADAREEVSGIEAAEWYVQDRTSLACFSGIDSDAAAIEAIASVFPVIFFVVAILVWLTAVTRMVEEDRSLIGLYKALGYSNAKIMSKYAVYVLCACLLGSAVGLVLGFVALPGALTSILYLMYDLPEYNLYFNGQLCAISLAMFCGVLTLAAMLACQSLLASKPASLMRPKAPRAGTRILLERIRPLWRRMSFLNKVTARNLFRYKQRFLMTILGVMGCTALMIFGFAVSDSVNALYPNQYGDDTHEGVDLYDLMAVCMPEDLDEAASQLGNDDEVESCTEVMYDSVTVSFDGESESMQIMVVPDGSSIEGYVELRDEKGTVLDLAAATSSSSNGVLLTKNASVMLGFSDGDAVTIQDSQLQEGEAEVCDVVMSYTSNTVFMTQSVYEEIFGTDPEANTLLAFLDGDDKSQIAYAEELRDDPDYLSVVSVSEQERDFSENFMLINAVVVLIIALAAGLSFVVLFTLSTTNISERERELATLKVLGFRRNEVRTYINKETIVLTLIGTLLGIPAGALLGHSLTYILKMPSMYFAVEIHPIGYIISCALSIVFALAIMLMTNRSLDRIDMVGALKSAE